MKFCGGPMPDQQDDNHSRDGEAQAVEGLFKLYCSIENSNWRIFLISGMH